ncbi:MAG TPA: hypothetical protein VHY56_00285 [Candidatus Binataceae bacterium]|jgi:hypothetical protein|nr:hypothetical protein [Candidatus Binataceae bacterium]
MVEEPRPTSEQPEGSADKPRVLGGRPGGSRVLSSDESEAAPAEATNEKAPGARSEARLAPNENPKDPAKAGGSGTDSAEALAEALRASRSGLEGLLAKTHEIHEQSWRAMQAVFEDLHQKLSKEHEARFAVFDKQVNERGRYQTAALLDKIDVEAESRLAARVDRALDKAQQAERQSMRSLEEKVEVGRASLIELTSTASQELQRQKTVLLTDLQADVQKHLGELKNEHAKHFDNLAKKTADSLSEQFAKRTAVASEAFQKRLQTVSEELTAQMEKKLAALTEAAVARISTEAQAVVARETSTHLIQALRKRLDQLAKTLHD